jgi:Flp pilus assembly protein TadD
MTFDEGLALHRAGRLTEAREIYRRVLEMQPGHADAHHLAGVIAYQTGNLAEAVELIGRAIELNPAMVAAYSNRGLALRDLKRPQEALACFDRALQLKPDLAVAHCNRGLALQDLDRLMDALASYEAALKLQPDYAEAYANRGNALNLLQRIDEALQSYDRALELRPDLAEAHWNRALCRLLVGDFTRGWEEYEWRWAYPHLKAQIGERRRYTQPLWLGAEPLQGKTILLYGEGGLGDTLQFCRYAKLAADAGARVILEVPAALLALLKNVAGASQVVEQGAALPAFDFHCPLPSLPLAFKSGLNAIPASDSYIACSAAKLAEWEARLGERAKPRIGLVWSGGRNHRNDRNRSIALGELIEYLPRQYQYVSLQKETRQSDEGALGSHGDILRFDGQLNDFSDTAALCQLMDVVVSVDTSVAHLAGAIGKPVWVMLPFVPDWRWLLDREDSPWYPSARLFRQEKAGDWAGVLGKVQSALLRSGANQ